jgi:sarcosine/dimethylglycine N-methyltransferase
VTAGSPVTVARDYYDSDDADRFYARVWGGEDIHIGIYESDADDIAAASRRTVRRLASRLDLGAATKVVDLGSGYCGAARYLAGTHGCHVTAINLSRVENARAEKRNVEADVADRIDVIEGSFETITRPSSSFDVAWSQDAILHAGDRRRVLAEVSRVLRPGGRFVFTDPMQSDRCPRGVLSPILARIHLESLGSPSFYREAARAVGLEEVAFEDLTTHLATHYERVLAETNARRRELSRHISPAYLDRMKAGLGHWIDGGRAGHLTWGIFDFRKPA